MKSGMWTEKETLFLIQEREKGVSYPKIAEKLGRGVRSVQARADVLGIMKARESSSKYVDTNEYRTVSRKYWLERALALGL